MTLLSKLSLTGLALTALLLSACGGQDANTQTPVPANTDERPASPVADLPIDETPVPPADDREEEEAEDPREEDDREDPREDDETPAEDPINDPIDDPVDPPVNAVCGDGLIEGEELCDGQNMGNLSCQSYGFGPGPVSCNASCRGATSTNSCTPLTYSPIGEVGGEITFSGALDDTKPTWSRPSDACEPGSQHGYYFSSHAIVNSTGRPQNITIHANFGETGDGFLHVFSVPFEPQTLTGCMVGNDDFNGIHESGFADVLIAPNQRMVVVVSTYGAGATIENFDLSVLTVEKNDELDPVEDPPVADDPPGDEPPVETPTGPTCGNGIIEAGEVCDGSNLAGNSCSALGYDFGVMACASSCSVFVSFCFGGDGEPPADDNDPPPPPADDPTPPGVATPVAPEGLAMQLSGSIDNTADTFARPNESCSPQSSHGYAYKTHRIVNNGSSSQRITLTGNWDNDGYLAVYTDDFDADASGSGCLEADDDFTANTLSGTNRLGSQVDNMIIFPGETLTVVATSFSEGEALGDYTIDVLTTDGENAVADMSAEYEVLSTEGTVHNNDAVFVEADKSRFFDSTVITNTSGKTLSLDVNANWHEGDGFLYVYTQNTSNENGLGLKLAENDDAGGTGASRIDPSDLYILPNETLVIVATSYAEQNPVGTYDLSVTSMP